jgi:ectoine hydroxylase-related dioxygenase (phytanoyl-CoA dioxygenase family)
MTHATRGLREELEWQGFAIVRGLLPPDEISWIAVAFERLVGIARQLPCTADVAGSRFVLEQDPFRLQRVVWCSAAEPTLARYGSDPRILALAAEALDSDELVQLVQQAHFKLPGDGVGFSWHQDASNRRYGTPLWTDVDGRGSFVQIAIAVDPHGAENGGLQVVPGSHAAGFVADPSTGSLPPDAVDVDRVIDPILEPGDALVFGPFLIHGSAPNQSEGPRRLFLQGYALPGANRREYPGCGLGVPRTLPRPTNAQSLLERARARRDAR